MVAATGEAGLMARPAHDEDLFDDDNHNPDFEHEEVSQWALDEWARELGQDLLQARFPGTEEEDRKWEAANPIAAAPAVVEPAVVQAAAAETNHPPRICGHPVREHPALVHSNAATGDCRTCPCFAVSHWRCFRHRRRRVGHR